MRKREIEKEKDKDRHREIGRENNDSNYRVEEICSHWSNPQLSGWNHQSKLHNL